MKLLSRRLLKIWPNEDWQDEATCATVGGDWWFVDKGGDTRPAKNICRECPVSAPCLEFALKNDEQHGIWGGLSTRERRRIKRSM